MTNDKNNEFHKPFLKNLVLIVVVTMFAMILNDKLVNYYSAVSKNTPSFTSQNSYNTTNPEQK